MASSTTAAAAAAAKQAFSSASLTKGPFQPRQFFEVSSSITRSYFLGHHHAALARMQRVLSNIGLVIECRDFRVPLTSWNPLLEKSLMSSASPTGGGERARIIVYTKRDLGPTGSDAPAGGGPSGSDIVNRLAAFHQREGHAAAVVFLGKGGAAGGAKLLDVVKRVAREHDSLTGLRALVVGMPNAGKSTLLNRLRAQGMGLGKAAKTGSEPGVTRKLGTPVRIVPGGDGSEGGGGGSFGEGVYIMDTPGVFVPYVSDAESMLKLALVGCVKDGLVSHVTVADYLLYHLNLRDPALYAAYCARPTNDVHEFLRGVAVRTGKLVRGGEPSLEAAADWIVKEWRGGELGRFVLDEVDDRALAAAVRASAEPPTSMNQARKREKELRKARQMERISARAQDAA